MSDWERFAREDPFFYICTGIRRTPVGESEREAFFQRGAETSHAILAEVEGELAGWSVVLEIGCGIGRLLLPMARRFEEARGVDVSPTMLAGMMAFAERQGVANVQPFLPDEGWDIPSGSVDYAYSYLVFQHIEDGELIKGYLVRLGRALRPEGIAQLQFDTRSRNLPYRARRFVPQALLPRTQRRGIRRIRRDPEWVRGAARRAGLEIVRERMPATHEHWFVLRRAVDPGTDPSAA